MPKWAGPLTVALGLPQALSRVSIEQHAALPVMNEDPSERLGDKGRRTNPMGNVGFKFRVIFVPYLVIATGLPIIYSLLHWLLIISTDVPPLDDDLVNFLLPLGLPWVPIMLWFRHRIKLLKWKGRTNKNDPFLGYLIAWLCLAAPTITVQSYLETAVGDLTQLERISQIDTRPHTKYYAVRDLIVDKPHARRWIRTSTTGRNSQNWNIGVYYAIPLLDSLGSFDATKSTAWLGVVYGTQFSNSLSQEDKHARLDEFIRQSKARFNGDDFHWISYLATVGRNKERQALEAAITSGGENKVLAPAALLTAHADSFEARNGSTISWGFGSYGIGLGIWFLLALTMKIDAAARHKWTRGEGAENGDLRIALAMLVPREGFFVTPLLLDLNVLVWVAMVFCGLGIDAISASDLLGWGAVHAAQVHDGEIWRLCTSLFVHAGIMHLANNMVALGLLGVLVERAFGSWWFAGVYLVTGVAGGITSMMWNPNLVSVGASGCIFGVAGFGLALLLVKRKRFASERPTLLKLAGAYLGINLLLGAILPGIDLVAHVAGLVGGALLGLIASPEIRGESANAK